MSELAKKLIEENLKSKNPVLDLGNCGLDGTEDELYLPLVDAKHLETLIFSTKWIEYDIDKKEITYPESENKEKYNWLVQVPNPLPSNLKRLMLGGSAFMLACGIKDISPLRKLDKLELLHLSFNANLQKNYSPLRDFKNLKALYLRNNGIKDTSFLEELKGLVSLDLRDNPIQNYSFLRKLTRLKFLYISDFHFHVREYCFLKGLKNLQSFALDLNNIQDISFLEVLKNLTVLSLAQSPKVNFSFLRDLKNLKSLSLPGNKLQNITFLKDLPHLQELNLCANPIQDFSSLRYLINLRKVYLDIENLPYPPIWLAYLLAKGGKLGDYIHLSELPQIEKIWKLLSSADTNNQDLALELARSQAWTEENTSVYQFLLGLI